MRAWQVHPTAVEGQRATAFHHPFLHLSTQVRRISALARSVMVGSCIHKGDLASLSPRLSPQTSLFWTQRRVKAHCTYNNDPLHAQSPRPDPAIGQLPYRSQCNRLRSPLCAQMSCAC